MKFVLEYTDNAIDQLDGLPEKEAQRILIKMEYYVSLRDPFLKAKPLQGQYKGCFRFRVGKYRIICRKECNGEIVVVFVLDVGHRKEIYR